MIDGNSLLIVDIISGVEGHEMFNFFFSLVLAGGILALVPAAIARLFRDTSRWA